MRSLWWSLAWLMKNTIFCFASLLFKKIIKDGPEAELALLWGLGKIIAKRPYQKNYSQTLQSLLLHCIHCNHVYYIVFPIPSNWATLTSYRNELGHHTDKLAVAQLAHEHVKYRPMSTRAQFVHGGRDSNGEARMLAKLACILQEIVSGWLPSCISYANIILNHE